VCLVIVAGLATTVWSQRVTAPVNGQPLNIVQGVAAAIDLPKDWKADRVSGLNYIAVAPTGALPNVVVSQLQTTVRSNAKDAGTDVYWPNTDIDATQKAVGKPVVVVYYGHTDSGPPQWIVYEDKPTETDVFVSSHAAALQQAAKWASRNGATVIDAG